MKNILSITLIMALLAACGQPKEAGSPLAAKQAQLKTLKADADKLKEQIATLESEIEKLDTTAKKERVTAIGVAAIVPETFTHSIDLQGTVRSDDEMMITPKGMGAITKVTIKIGDYVKAGQAIGYLDDAVMKQGISQIQTQLDFARQNFEKLDRLWKQGIGTEVQMLGAKTQVEALEKQIATMNEQNSGSVVRAPKSGVIDEVYAKVGMPAAPGAPFAKLVNKTGLKVVADIAEGYSGKIRTGNEVILNFPDIKKEVRSRIGYVSQTINPLNRTYRVDIPVSGADMIPNMISVIRVVDYNKPRAIVVPINLIQKSGEERYVFVTDNASGSLKAKKVVVTVGQTYSDRAEILSGLQAGSQLITVGYQELNDGDLVSVK